MPNTHMHPEPQPRKQTKSLPKSSQPAVDEQVPKLDTVIHEFLVQVPEFTDFANASSEDIAWYREHHHQGLVKAQQFMQDIRNGVPEDDFPNILGRFLGSVEWYFDWREVMHWRDAASHEGFAEEATAFFRSLPLTTQQDYEHYSHFFAEEFGKGFAEVNYFLLFCHFVSNPNVYCAMKLSRLEKVFRQMGIEMKLKGHLLSFAEFKRINSIATQLFQGLKQYHPTDMTDVQIVMHYCGGESWKQASLSLIIVTPVYHTCFTGVLPPKCPLTWVKHGLNPGMHLIAISQQFDVVIL